MTSIRRPPSPQSPPEWLIGLIIALVLIGLFSLVQYFVDQRRYKAAIQSYEIAECDIASKKFKQIINAFRVFDFGEYVPQSKEKKAECDFFQDAVNYQEEGMLDSALLNYAKLATYETSPLLEYARNNLRELFQKSSVETETLATLEVCNRLEILTEKNLLPPSDPNAQSVYSSCGKTYEIEKSYEEAISIYENFLKMYPNHPLIEDVKRSLARTTITQIKEEEEERYIESPERTGITADGSTVVEIQNSSPAEMRIIFSGTTPKFEELEDCDECQKYIGEPPGSCPGKGPIGRYTLEPGEYEIVIKFKANDRERVNPWAGNWNLEQGALYKRCFFIIQDSLDDFNQEDSF